MVSVGPEPKSQRTAGIDPTKLRLTVLGILVFAAFVALFSRLWFLQVLAAEQYTELARENRVRRVESEPPRGDILDRNGKVLVKNRRALAVAIDKQVFDDPAERGRVLRKLSKLLDEPLSDLRSRLNDVTVSPYKPVVVATDVTLEEMTFIDVNPEDFPGVSDVLVPVREFPKGRLASHLLGYVGEISPEGLKSPHFKNVKPGYSPGDIVGRDGLEYTYDRFLRGKPQVKRVIVNATDSPVRESVVQDQSAGNDLVLSLDADIQKLTEQSLEAGINAARVAYQAPAGAAIVMDPSNGEVIATASYPDFEPNVLADGITQKEFDALGQATPEDPDDDALFNRAIAGQRQPGSTYKVVTAGAAMAHDIISPFDELECPGSATYPPEGGSGSVLFRNWTSTYFGFIGVPTSLEISCDTFYYELGWRMEDAWGGANGDGSEKFQKYARQAGIGKETGIDVPNEAEGRVPDVEWCTEYREITDGAGCADGWLPGYTVNMSIGQGDLIVTPIQMAVTYAAIANGGTVWQPRLGMALQTGEEGSENIVREFEAKEAGQLPLDATELGVIQEGLELVIGGGSGTARGAFAGFPLEQFPIAGKTGTAELGETDLNDAWFVSYGPTTDPRYVIAVYLEKAGHGGESAAPIARQIWEGIFGIDDDTNVRLGTDLSG